MTPEEWWGLGFAAFALIAGLVSAVALIRHVVSGDGSGVR